MRQSHSVLSILPHRILSSPYCYKGLVSFLTIVMTVACGSPKAGSPAPNQQSAKPGQIRVAPSSVSFGIVQVGNNQSQPATITNSGGSDLKVTQATTTGTGFSVGGLSLPVNLAPGQSQGFTIIFMPHSADSINGNLAIANTGSAPTVNVALSGGSQTVGTLSPSSSSLNFGSVQMGSKQILPETLTNKGGSDVTVTQVNATGTGFSVSGFSLPLILAAGQSQAFNVVFTPSSVGGSSG